MERPLTPSAEAMSDGQIDKLTDNVRAALRKARLRFPAVNIQKALETGRLDVQIATAVVTAVEESVTKVANTLIRIVFVVDRGRTPNEVLDATKRRKCVNDSVVATMPTGESGMVENVQVEFFKLGRFVSDNQLALEFQERGLIPDPYAVARVNEDDKAFANEHPNGTHWKDSYGSWCCLTCSRLDGECYVGVGRRGGGWGETWWFGGVRK